MNKISISLIYFIIIISFNFNNNVTYIQNTSILEMVYIIDRKVSIKINKIIRFRSKFFNEFFNIKKQFFDILKKYISFKSYNKINTMVNLE